MVMIMMMKERKIYNENNSMRNRIHKDRPTQLQTFNEMTINAKIYKDTNQSR